MFHGTVRKGYVGITGEIKLSMEQLLNGECLFCQIDEQIEYS